MNEMSQILVLLYKENSDRLITLVHIELNKIASSIPIYKVFTWSDFLIVSFKSLDM